MRKRKVFFIYTSTVNIVSILLIFFSVLREYKFIVIPNSEEFLRALSFLFLPLIISCFLILYYVKKGNLDEITNSKRDKVQTIYLIVAYSVLSLGYYNMQHIIMISILGSMTENINNYAIYDLDVKEDVINLFPKKITNEYKDVEYYYEYSKFIGSANYLIELKYTLPDTDFENEIKKISNLDIAEVNKDLGNIVQFKINYVYITFYKPNRKVKYCFATGKGLIFEWDKEVCKKI